MSMYGSPFFLNCRVESGEIFLAIVRKWYCISAKHCQFRASQNHEQNRLSHQRRDMHAPMFHCAEMNSLGTYGSRFRWAQIMETEVEWHAIFFVGFQRLSIKVCHLFWTTNMSRAMEVLRAKQKPLMTTISGQLVFWNWKSANASEIQNFDFRISIGTDSIDHPVEALFLSPSKIYICVFHEFLWYPPHF